MFEIPVGDIIASFVGDSKELEFNGTVYDGYYDDIKIIGNLELKIRIIGLDDGVSVIIDKLKAKVKYRDNIRFIELDNIEREFREKFDPANPDDIKYVNKSGMTIDLHDIILEEILIQSIE